MKTLLALLFYIGIGSVFAQVSPDSVRAEDPQKKEKRDPRPFMSRISLGGSTGFWINPAQVHVEVSPMLAYRFQKIWTVGAGYRYIYVRNIVYGKNLNNYGPNLFVRAAITKRIYLWSEWEHLKSEYALAIANQEVTTNTDQIDSFFMGAGYVRQLGRKGRGGISFQLLYNMLYHQEENAPYYSPLIYRIGYFF